MKQKNKSTSIVVFSVVLLLPALVHAQLLTPKDTNDGSERVAMNTAAETPVESGPKEAESFAPGQTLAIVGGYPVFVSDMSVELNQIIQQNLAGAPPEVVKQFRGEIIRRILPRYIDSKLMYVDVISGLPKEANLDKIFEEAGKQFDEHVLPVLQKQAKMRSAAEMDAYLRSQGSSLRLMRKSWSENELTKYMTKEKIQSDPEVTRQELLEYYKENEDEFKVVARARWEEIMVKFDQFDDRLSAKKAMAEMGNKIVGGASFAAVARKSSNGFTASDGGKYDWTVKGSLVSPELDRAIFELPIDHLSEIIETQTGFHIVRVIERQESGHIPFVEAQTEIRKKLVQIKQDEEFKQHMAKLRRTIPVEILIDQ